ncbi:MAG: hypothetical protein Q7K98_05225 [Candidatus Omnitrophota bacterium]|nr:hypothetical protein [Candidatus Omnitrophota bacterium]
MRKKAFNFIDRILHLFTYHPWLKLISLVLAIIVWLYIKEEMSLGQ